MSSLLEKEHDFSVWEHPDIQVLEKEQLDELANMPKSLRLQYLLQFYNQGVMV